jgi:predicted Zn finger-like uncharacterized protein
VTKILAQCPGCKTQFKIPNAEQMAGKKVICKKCQTAFRIRAPKPATKRPADDDEIIDVGEEALVEEEDPFLEDAEKEDEILDGEILDGEPAEADEDFDMPPARPLAGRRPAAPSALKRPGKTKGKKKPEGGGGEKKKPAKNTNTMLVVIIVVVSLLAFGGIGGGYYLVLQLGKTAKYHPPKKKDYIDFRPKNFQISCKIPKDWKEEHGGGMAGQPVWCRFTDGKLIIEARESISGGAMGQAALAGQQNADPMGKNEAISAVQRIHEDQEARFAENYVDYNEEPARKIMTGFGDSRISDFTAKEGLLKSNVSGCRATILNTIHQFTVSCKCPPAIFKDAKPVFEKVVISMGGGTAP